MIQFNSTVTGLLNSNNVEAFYLVEIDTLRFTNFYNNFELNDNGVLYKTYISDGRLMKLDPPTPSSSVDKNSYTLVLADSDFSSRQYNWTSKSVEVRIAFVNNKATNQLDSKGFTIKPNHPYRELSDTVLIYKGIVDSVTQEISTEVSGEVLLNVVCVSPMHNLDFKRVIRLNKDNMRDRDYTDSCCDRIYEGSTKLRLLWGKA
jgi:hypothetical protein